MLWSIQMMASDEFFHTNEDTITKFYTKLPSLNKDSFFNIKRFAIVNTSSLFGLAGS